MFVLEKNTGKCISAVLVSLGRTYSVPFVVTLFLKVSNMSWFFLLMYCFCKTNIFLCYFLVKQPEYVYSFIQIKICCFFRHLKVNSINFVFTIYSYIWWCRFDLYQKHTFALWFSLSCLSSSITDQTKSFYLCRLVEQQHFFKQTPLSTYHILTFVYTTWESPPPPLSSVACVGLYIIHIFCRPPPITKTERKCRYNLTT